MNAWTSLTNTLEPRVPFTGPMPTQYAQLIQTRGERAARSSAGKDTHGVLLLASNGYLMSPEEPLVS
jgi:hypothetical protein